VDLGLTGKKALITGSTAGIGLATARELAREGAEVIVNGRTRARVDGAVQAVLREAPGAKVRGVAADVSTAEGCGELLRAVPDVDVLVNNAGVFEPVPFEEIADEAWFRIFETNVMSGVRLARHHFPRMLARSWGRIVFVSSESALQTSTTG